MLFPKTSNPLPPPLLLPIPKDCCLLEDAVEGKGDENISPTDSDAREEEEEEEDEAGEGAEDAPKTPNKSFESFFEYASTTCDAIVVDAAAAAAVTGALLPFCCCAKGLCAAPPPPPDVDAELAVKAGADATLLLASFDPRLIRDTFKIILFPNAGIISSG